MTYCTQADLVREFGAVELVELTDRADPPTGEIDAERVAEAIETAAAEINVYLEGRYSLPLASVPTVLRRVAVDMARYFLHVDIGEDHPVAQRYVRQVKLLRGIADGTLSLGLDTAGAVQAPADTIQVSAGRNDWGANW
ncbi:gp436 family protein [Ralstonia pseudosolanacearum]